MKSREGGKSVPMSARRLVIVLVAWSSFEMVENLFGCDIHGDDRIHPEWQSVTPGDSFALHPEMGLRVAEVTPERHPGPEFHATWAFVLSPVERRSGGTGTRVHLRERYEAPTETGLAVIKALSAVSAVTSWRMLSRLAVLTTRQGIVEPRPASLTA